MDDVGNRQDSDEKDDEIYEGEITKAEKDNLKFDDTETSFAEVDEEQDMQIAMAIIAKSRGIEIRVANPTEKKGGLMSKNYHVYEIIGSDKIGEIKVFRRYTEFEAVRRKLKENWPGIFIPAIPDKAVKNSDQKVIQERLLFLDHFVKKCARMDHIYYSEEFQIFLRSAGPSDEVIKALNGFPARTCATIYNQYRILFPDFDETVTKDKEDQISKRIACLKTTLSEVITMRTTLKVMMFYRKDLQNLKGEFTKYIAKEAVNKIENEAEQEECKQLVRDYAEVEKIDDLTILNNNLKILKKDIESFFLITNDLSFVFRSIGESTSIIQSTTKDLSMLKSLDKEVISEGLFKKVNRNDKIRELERNQEMAKDELSSAQALRGLIFNMLERQEIPLILYVKNQCIADGFVELASKRRKCLEKEEEALKRLADVLPISA